MLTTNGGGGFLPFVLSLSKDRLFQVVRF